MIGEFLVGRSDNSTVMVDAGNQKRFSHFALESSLIRVRDVLTKCFRYF